MKQISQGDKGVMNGSLIHKLYPSLTQKTYINPEKGLTDPNAPLWNALPKKIWMMRDSGLSRETFANRIAFEIAKKKHKDVGFEASLITM